MRAIRAAGVVIGCLGFLLVGARAEASAQDAREDWTKLHLRSGASVDYPASIFRLEKTQRASDFPVFDRKDGRAHFAFFRKDNPKRLTLRQLAQVQDHGPVHYRRISSNFFVVSGVRQGMVFYRRCNTDRTPVHLVCFDIAYPGSELRDWDAIVTRISLSLKAR